MKKKIIFSLTMFMILGINNGLSNINEVKANDERIIIMNPSYGLGYSVNLAKDECIDIDKLNNNVLNPASLTQTSTTLNTSSTVIKHSNDFNDLVDQIESYYGLSSSCSTPDYSLFTATVASKYQDLTRMDYTAFPYQYYSTYIYTYKYKTYSITGYNSSNLSSITRTLNDDYVEDLEALLYDDADIETFFDTYGTHIVGSMVTGGRLEVNYSIISEHYDVWQEKYNTLTNYLNVNLYNKLQNPNANIAFDPQSGCGISSIASRQEFNFNYHGGAEIGTSTPVLLNLEFNEWKNSITSYPEIIQPTSDGLIPLWNLLPGDLNTTAYKNLFKQKYNEYMSINKENIENQYIPEIIQNMYASTGYKPIRTGELVVTDDSEFDQHADVANLNGFAYLKYDYFKHYGFTKMDLYLRMEMKEIDMGYQHVYFYNSEKENSNYMVEEFTYELGGNSLITDYELVVYCRKNIPLSTFDNSDPNDYAKFVARYSASGTFEDDWQNMAIYLCVVYHN